MSSTPKVVGFARKAVFNQFMTRETVLETNELPIYKNNDHQQSKNIRLHDETVHLRFGFPNLKKPTKL